METGAILRHPNRLRPRNNNVLLASVTRNTPAKTAQQTNHETLVVVQTPRTTTSATHHKPYNRNTPHRIARKSASYSAVPASVSRKPHEVGVVRTSVTPASSCRQEGLLQAQTDHITSLPSSAFVYVGNFTREVYEAISPRIGHTLHIPEDLVANLFHEMHLFPSKNQVNEMLQCARHCSGRKGCQSKYITFGEFCVFVREMQQPNSSGVVAGHTSSPYHLHHHHRHHHHVHRQQLPFGFHLAINGVHNTSTALQPTSAHKLQSHTSAKSMSTRRSNGCDVFLGGSCNPTTWRSEIAIPELSKQGITYYNPQVAMWAPELVAQERAAKESATVLLFVIDSQTRNVGGMIEVAYLVAKARRVVLVVQPHNPNQVIMGESVSQREYSDLMDGQQCLLDLVKAHGITVHESLPAALECTAKIVQKHRGVDKMQPAHKLRELKEIFETYGGEKGNINFVDMLSAFQKVTQREPKISELLAYMKSINETTANRGNLTINFEQFCLLMTEFATASSPMRALSDEHENDLGRCEDSSTAPEFDVFLGGAIRCSSKWRQNIAIPMLTKSNLKFFDPSSCKHRKQRSYPQSVVARNGNGCTICNHINGVMSIKNNKSNNGFTCNLQQSHDTSLSNSNIMSTSVLECTNLSPYCYPGSYTELNGKHRNETKIERSCTCNNYLNWIKLEWDQVICSSRLLLFVITNDTRSLSSMVLAAYFIGIGKPVVLCIQHLPEHCTINDESLSSQAIKDYNRGRNYLADFAKQNQVHVFDDITEAIQATINFCRP